MSVYAIGDLHLPGHAEKPMDVFGSQWDRHFETISQNWRAKITEDDVVLLPGDLSWAMQLAQAADDLNAVGELPGTKLILRGNHDYWWCSLTKLRAALPPRMYAVQNDALRLGDLVFCGTRGWLFPTAQQALNEQDEKIYKRELMRLRMSLEEARKLGGSIVCMLHFPPLFADGIGTAFTDLLEEFGVRHAVYGHLHGAGIKIGFDGERNGVTYHLVSCDALRFDPKRIEET